MKTRPFILLCILFCGSGTPVLAQGYFYMQNYWSTYNIDAPVYDAEGTPLFGENYLASLYGGPAPDALQEAFRIYTTEPLRVPFTDTPNGMHGYFRAISTGAEIPSVHAGMDAWLQVRAWDARLGNSYEEAVAKGQGGYGASALFRQTIYGGNPYGPYPLYDLQSFSLVPEPGSCFILISGLGILAICRRKRV